MDLNIQFIKSPSDDRIYKMIRLPNGMDCLIVSDPEADKSAASMSVDIGTCDDPDTRPGLAHFLEHMLFMGTKKYPEQNEYSKYLNMNSGHSNAFTASTFTNYHFACSNDAFEGALDRFAQFFIEPLFDQTCVDKELNAVNSESELNVVDDSWREMLVFKTAAKKSHPYSKFPVGNLKTLQHPTIRDEVLKFYNDHYSSNLMRLCVCGADDIETLESWVKKYFEKVPDKKYERRVLKEMPFAKEHLSNSWKLVPIMDHDYLEVAWIFEGMFEHYKSHPLGYLANLIGHEGENSLLSLLIAEGLVTSLEAGPDDEMNLFHVFAVRVKLTPYGFENYKQVIGYIFQYINMLKQKGPQKWFFDELHQVQDLEYEFMEKEDSLTVASGLSSKLLYWPYQDVLKLDYFMEDYNENLLSQTIQGFTLDNMRVSMSSKKYESECTLVEEWYGAKYTVAPLDQDIIDMYNGKNLPTPKRTKKVLDLPPKNIFLPENFDVHAQEGDDLPDEPEKIKDDEFSEVWYKQDNKFFLPRADIYLHMYFRDGNFGRSVDASTLAKLWLKLFKHHVQEMGYLAEEAGISYSFFQDQQGHGLQMNGYSNTILVVLKKLFEKLLDFKPQDLLEIYKDLHHEALQKYKNFINDDSGVIGGYLFEILTCVGNCAPIEKKVESLNRIVFEDLLALHQQILQNIKLIWYFTGNLLEEDVLNTVAEVEDILINKRQDVKCKPLPSSEIQDINIVEIPDGSTWIYEYNHTREKLTDTANTSSVIYQVYQLKVHNDRTRILNDLFEFYIRESFFNQLRTNEQLGYAVSGYTEILRGIQHFTFFIQSDVKSPSYLRERIGAFLEDWRAKFDTLIGTGDEAEKLQEDFTKTVESLRVEYLEKLLHLGEEASRYWREIQTRQYYWNRRAEYAEQLLTITKEEFREFVLENYFKDPKKIEVHVISESMKEENEKHKAENRENINFIESIEEFKKTVSLHPDFYSMSKL